MSVSNVKRKVIEELDEVRELVGIPADEDYTIVCVHCGHRLAAWPVPVYYDAQAVAAFLKVSDETLRKFACKQDWERRFRLQGRNKMHVRCYTASEVKTFADRYRATRPAESVPMKIRHENAAKRKAASQQYRLAGRRDWKA